MQKMITSFVLGLFFAVPLVTQARIPNDPYAEQWGYADVGVYNAWDYATGSDDTVVAIIDNGFDTFHPDLRDNVWKNINEIPDNNIDDDNNGYVDDVYGWNFLDDDNNPRPDIEEISASEIENGVFHHGTIVAGIIGAKGNNGRDGAGINWDVKLMNLKVLGNNGSGDLSPLVDAIYYAVDNGADVINISMVGNGAVTKLKQAIDYAYERDVVVVAAAGNSVTDLEVEPHYPVCSDNTSSEERVLGVSAIDEDHYLATFSSYGSTCIDITAPGVGIQSTLRYSPTNDLSDTYSTDMTWSGTSFSTPFVSGAAALLKGMGPGFSAQQIIALLAGTTHHTPSDDEDAYADLYGDGLLQIDKAVNAARVELEEPIAQQDDSSQEDTSILEKTNEVLFIAPRTGEYEYRQGGLQKNNPKFRATFTRISDVETYIVDDDFIFVAAIFEDEEGQKNVTIYDNSMRLMQLFPVGEFQGKGDIAVGDIDGDGDHEFAVAYMNGTDAYIELYEYEGDVIAKHVITHVDEYVSVDVAYNEEAFADDIIVSYVQDGHTYIDRYNSTFDLYDTVQAENIIAADIQAFDIDNDGALEYILGAAPGRQSYVYVYNLSGEEEYRFRVYSPAMKSGIDISFIDYDDNGSVEVVVTPQAGDAPVYMIDRKGNVLESWWPFGRQNLGQVFVLGL